MSDINAILRAACLDKWRDLNGGDAANQKLIIELVAAIHANALHAAADDPVVVDRVAKSIASAMGDNFSDAFKNKARWIAKRGKSGGRFRDVNEPFQHDYIDAARAAILTLIGGK